MKRRLALLLCLTSCGTAPTQLPLERDLRLAGASGREAFARGNLRVAEASFRAQLDCARLLDDAHEVGNAAYDLAATRCELAVPAAEYTTLLDEARAAFARGVEPAAIAEVDLLAARALLAAGDTKAARLLLEPPDRGDDTELVARRQLLLVELAVLERDAAAARRLFTAACAGLGEDAATPQAPPLLLALARVHVLEADWAAAAAAFDAAADGWRARRLPRRMAQAMLAAANAFATANDAPRATDRALRAAGAFVALGDAAPARTATDLAATTATASGDAGAAQRARQLRERIED